MVTETSPVRTGLIGCGNIAPTYLKNASRFSQFQVVGCADKNPASSERIASDFALPRVLTVDELLHAPEIELVLNLTPPAVHAQLLQAAIEAGKHVYTEKPLGLSTSEVRPVLDAAASKGLLVGCAPDTVLGAGIQTARKLIDDGWIGTPTSATAFMQCPGHESWHPAPEFYYEPGGGPLLDMGPYYISALITLLGPVKAVAAMANQARSERIITGEERYGERIPVSVPTHVAGTMAFQNGAIATLVMSFDVPGHHLPYLEIHGTEGSLQLPDPNTFGGELRLKRWDAAAFSPVPASHGFREESRGSGVADMAVAIRTGRAPRANASVAYHVLDIMESMHVSAARSEFVTLGSSCERPLPLRSGVLGDNVFASKPTH